MTAIGVMHRALRLGSLAACVAGAASAAQAQTGIPVFSPVNVRLSTNGASVANPLTVGTASLDLSCSTSPITALISSTPDGTGKVLVDNYVDLTVAQGLSAPDGPVNLCGPAGTGAGSNPASCFRMGYSVPASQGLLTGQDPDGAIAAAGGVSPIDISSYLALGTDQLTFNMVDFGGYLASTSIYLYTNCTSKGTSGNGKISGNPISSTNPTPSQLTQPFVFSGTTDLTVAFQLDLSKANGDGTLDITNGATPTVTDKAFDPALFPSYVAGTSFATSQCLIHNGELLNGSPACKLYTLTCQIGQGSNASGVQCPTSTARNIVIQDVFDFPPLSLPDITYTKGNVTETFHQGFGLLEASEGWTGGPCTFDPAAGQMFSCPENLLTQFTGPGLGRGTGTPQPGLNSTFISVGPVPLYRTHVDLSPWSSNRTWVNSHTITATFNTRAPILPQNFNDGNLNGFIAAPLYGVTYGVSPVAGFPDVPSTEFPVPGDKTLLYPDGCNLPAPEFYSWPSVTLNVATDGEYLVHYFATDCAGTEELFFRNNNPTQSWYTEFYTAKMFVDTVKPQVSAGPLLSPAPTYIHGVLGYHKGQCVTATYQCTDELSGVAQCGAKSYANPVKTPAKVKSPVDTSNTGTFTYSVAVKDAARNVGTPVSASYRVVGP